MMINYETAPALIAVILMVKDPGSKQWERKGTRSFAVLPRIGEHIELDVDGHVYLYRVVSVHHPHEAMTTAGNVLAVRVGPTAEVMRQVFERESAA